MSSVMDSVVKEICESMLNNPNRWRIETHILKDLHSGVQYWISSIHWEYPTITHVWNGHSRDEVFTEEQGHLIYEAYIHMKDYKASAAQEKVLASFKVKSKEVTSQKAWWEFWK